MKNKKPIQIEASMIGRHGGGDDKNNSKNRYKNKSPEPKSPI